MLGWLVDVCGVCFDFYRLIGWPIGGLSFTSSFTPSFIQLVVHWGLLSLVSFQKCAAVAAAAAAMVISSMLLPRLQCNVHCPLLHSYFCVAIAEGGLCLTRAVRGALVCAHVLACGSHIGAVYARRI